MARNTYFPVFYFQVDIENLNNSLIRKTRKAIESDNKWLTVLTPSRQKSPYLRFNLRLSI